MHNPLPMLTQERDAPAGLRVINALLLAACPAALIALADLAVRDAAEWGVLQIGAFQAVSGVMLLAAVRAFRILTRGAA